MCYLLGQCLANVLWAKTRAFELVPRTVQVSQLDTQKILNFHFADRKYNFTRTNI